MMLYLRRPPSKWDCRGTCPVDRLSCRVAYDSAAPLVARRRARMHRGTKRLALLPAFARTRAR
eukprot:5470789-Alexandrium_andersonii.AAC.1